MLGVPSLRLSFLKSAAMAELYENAACPEASPHPFALSLSKGFARTPEGFDRLRANGKK
jgi:hypothetical protein